ncbi:hypothetical protein IFM46972_02041 [Aspergillus udagawae]|uniref:Uncharacterized protein n=1 Tax=Aspergillus udagawae TaxID=91492 RepID=A0A8H3NDF9_9EURO|nr:hypothetical protein IFM46972_02041 [Aspergillus udagawae]
MDPLNNVHINDDFNYEQDEIYTGSNVIWRAIHYTGPPVQTLGGHLAPAPTLDMSFPNSILLSGVSVQYRQYKGASPVVRP